MMQERDQLKAIPMIQGKESKKQNKQHLEGTCPFSSLGSEVVIEARMEYIKILAATILGELNYLHEFRSDKKFQLTLSHEVHRFEIQLIRNALIMSFGAQRSAAKILGIHPTTLHEKIKRFKIRIPTETDPVAESVIATNDEPDTAWPVSFNEARTQFEIKLIQRALQQAGGSLTRAAELLKIPIPTLDYKMGKLGIVASNFSIRRRGKVLSTR